MRKARPRIPQDKPQEKNKTLIKLGTAWLEGKEEAGGMGLHLDSPRLSNAFLDYEHFFGVELIEKRRDTKESYYQAHMIAKTPDNIERVKAVLRFLEPRGKRKPTYEEWMRFIEGVENAPKRTA